MAYTGILEFTDSEGNVLTEVDVGWDNGVVLGLNVETDQYPSVTGTIYRNTTSIGEFHYEVGHTPEVIWYVGEGIANLVKDRDVLRAVIEQPIKHEVSITVKRKQIELIQVSGSAPVVALLTELDDTIKPDWQITHALKEIAKTTSIRVSHSQALNIRNLEQFMSDVYPGATIPAYAYHDPVKLQEALNSLQPPSLLEIFNNWTRTEGHNYYPNGEGAIDDAAAWYWDEERQTVVQPINTNRFTAFISPESVESYDAAVTLTSTHGDDDWICFVLAFHRNETTNINKSLTVSICRGADNDVNEFSYPNYYISKNMESNSRDNIYISNSFADGGTGGWSGKKFRVWARRRGDQFTIYGSGWDDLTRKPESLMSFNLNDHPDLAVYKGPRPYGYGATSQAESSFEDLVLSGGVNYNIILDMLNNRIYRFANGTWAIVEGVTIHDIYGSPRVLTSMDSDDSYLLKPDGTIVVQ